jgi:protein-S-isoprenylcysteine O-methyltransferase Ste14
VFLGWVCVVCPPAGAIAIIFWFTAGTACKNAEERRLAKMRSTRPTESPRPDG